MKRGFRVGKSGVVGVVLEAGMRAVEEESAGVGGGAGEGEGGVVAGEVDLVLVGILERVEGMGGEGTIRLLLDNGRS